MKPNGVRRRTGGTWRQASLPSAAGRHWAAAARVANVGHRSGRASARARPPAPQRQRNSCPHPACVRPDRLGEVVSRALQLRQRRSSCLTLNVFRQAKPRQAVVWLVNGSGAAPAGAHRIFARPSRAGGAVEHHASVGGTQPVSVLARLQRDGSAPPVQHVIYVNVRYSDSLVQIARPNRVQKTMPQNTATETCRPARARLCRLALAMHAEPVDARVLRVAVVGVDAQPHIPSAGLGSGAAPLQISPHNEAIEARIQGEP